ncbi:MFS general substrate transporter [Teratosphaeria nubilosa]|uniref:MFS general substrate transporter n=1 Tax=Teratosphaeria nubilosa TaxID=161662 RepID=A0A6G1L5Z7_9PEZI|nr:MFS general substrate transporter [Teratosphaeria nubilosa]
MSEKIQASTLELHTHHPAAQGQDGKADVTTTVTESVDKDNEPAYDYAGAHDKIDPKEIALVRKLDLFLMPILWIMYFLNYLDRNAIALARLDGLEDDLKLKGRQYETCVSMLFVGYILGQVPSNMIITRVRPSLWLSGFMALWAVVSGSAALTHDYKSMVVARFFLGVTEAPWTPGALYILSIFYNRKEMATRISIMYSGNVLANAFAGLIAAGVFDGMGGAQGLAGWRWYFILIGVITFVVAILSAFVLPDDPLTTRWLTPEERQLANSRIVRDTVDHAGPQTSLKGLWDIMKDPKVWIFCFMDHAHVAATGFKNFFPTVVKTLGFSRTVTLVLTCPPYLIAALVAIYWSWQSCRYNEKTYHMIAAKLFAAFGFALAAGTLNMGARYFAMIVFSTGTYCCNALIYSWLSSTCGHTKEKKASAMALVNTIANVGFVWTPYLWPKSNAPRYDIPLGSCAGFSVLGAACALFIKFMLKRLNRSPRHAEDGHFIAYAY